MPERIKLLIAEDDNLLRRTLVELFQLDPSFDIVAHVSNGQSALEQAGATQPDVLLTDIDMPVMDGIEATKHFLNGLVYGHGHEEILVYLWYALDSLIHRFYDLGTLDKYQLSSWCRHVTKAALHAYNDANAKAVSEFISG